jgi:signal transduction histidine kinase
MRSCLASLLLFFFSTSVTPSVHADNPPSDSLKELLQSATEDATRFEALLELYKLHASEDSALAAQYEQQARSLARQMGDELRQARLARQVSLKYLSAREYQKFDSITTSIMNIFKEHGEMDLYAHCLNNLGSSLFYQGDLVESEKYKREALEYYEPGSQDYLETSFDIVISMYQQSRYTEALKRLLPLAEQFKAKGDDYYYANSLVMMANIYDGQDNRESAKEYFKLYVEKCKAIGFQSGVGGGNLNLANVYHQEGHYRKALEHATVAREIFESNDNPYQLSNTMNTIAGIHQSMGEYSKSWSFYDQALQLSEQYGFKNRISEIYQNQSNLLLLEENYPEAIEKARKAFQIGQQTRTYKRIRDAAFNLYDANKALGRNDSALHYHEAYARYKDSVRSEQNSQQVQALKTNFEIRRRTWENERLEADNQLQALQIKQQRSQILIFALVLALAVGIVALLVLMNRKLKAKNRIISSQKEELKKTNALKDNMFSIIAHDLRGPIGNFQGLLELMGKGSKHNDPDENDEILELMRQSASSTYSLLENLLNWARAQKDEIDFRPKAENLRDLVNEVVQLKSSEAEQKDIRLNHNLDTDLHGKVDYHMVNLVIRNLVDNAIKFTPRGGEVDIRGEATEEAIKIAVKDSGQGMPEEVRQKVFDPYDHHTEAGTENEKGSGLGLKLCREFIAKHSGDIWVETTQGQGTTFVFTLPVN